MPSHTSLDLPLDATDSDRLSGRRWVLYTRTARLDPRDPDAGALARQEAACRAAIARHDPDGEVVRAIQDVGSGLDAQPGLQEARDLIGAGGADALMAEDLNRIGRRVDRTLALAEEMDQQGAALHLVNPGGGAPVSRLALSALSSFAEAARA